MIRIDNLVKTFGAVRALDGLSLEARPGEVLALLGPNGAGKSTTIKSIVGLVKPTSGQVLIDGIDVARDPRGARQKLGYLPQAVAFYDNLSAREVLVFFAQLRGAPLGEIDPLLERVGLASVARRRVAGFSGGMLQRLGLAAALLGDPSLLVLDEPTAGLDPEGAALFKEIIRERHQARATILLSSHLLVEIQSLADRVAICSAGRVVALDTPSRLREEMALPSRMVLRLENTNGHTPQLALDAGAQEAEFADGTLKVVLPGDRKVGLLRRLEEDGVRVRDVHTEEATLEEVFFAYVQRERKERP